MKSNEIMANKNKDGKKITSDNTNGGNGTTTVPNNNNNKNGDGTTTPASTAQIPSASSGFEVDVDAMVDAQNSNTNFRKQEPANVAKPTTISDTSRSVSTTTTTTNDNNPGGGPAAVIMPKGRRITKTTESAGVPISPSLTGGTSNSPPPSQRQRNLPRKNMNKSFDSTASSVASSVASAASSIEPDRIVQRGSGMVVVDDEATATTTGALGPQSRVAREQRKMKQQQQQQPIRDGGTEGVPPVASMPSVAANSANSDDDNVDTSGDLQAALALARQDMQTKMNQQGGAAATNEVVADQRRMAGGGEEENENEEEPPQQPEPAASAQQPTTATTSSSPPRPAVPVGAFRINPSTSGRFAIQNAAEQADVSISPTEATTSSNNNTQQRQPVIESNLVFGATLVEEGGDNNNEETASSSRRGGGGSGSRGGGSSSQNNNNNDNNNNNKDNDEENPSPSVTPTTAATTTAAMLEEAAPLPYAPSDDSGVMIVTAETPTLNDSVWTLLKSRKGRWGIIFLIVLVATLTVLGVTVWEKQNVDQIINIHHVASPTTDSPTLAPSPVPTHSAAPTNIPTIAPTTSSPTASPTIRQFTIQDLPNETIALIETQPNSPQAKAWRWLQDDLIDYSPTGSAETIPQADQILQRFCLATIYYSSNGPGWQFQRYWLDHETSECDWWPHVKSVSWPYTQGDRVCNIRGGFTDLLLADNLLSGTLPPELALLPYLKTVDVSNNPDLTGQVPPEVCDVHVVTTTDMEQDEDEGTGGGVGIQQQQMEVKISCDVGLTCDCCTCATERRLIDWG